MPSVADDETVAVARICWTPCWRLVASRFPPVGLFDRVASPEDLDIVLAIEGLTNDRLRDEVGDLSLVPDEDRISGAGTTPIMAAFTHVNENGSRFSDGSYGVYYAARSIDTTVAEAIFGRERFLRATQERPIELDMRAYASNIDDEFHDIRGERVKRPELYNPDPDQYAPAQSFAAALRANGSNGIVYESVRDPGGECVAIFRPRLLTPVVQGPHFCFVWDGRSIVGVYTKSEYTRH
jgi:hypothetical protein